MKRLVLLVFGFIFLLVVGVNASLAGILETTKVNGQIILTERFVLLDDLPKLLSDNFSLEEIKGMIDGRVEKLSFTAEKKHHSTLMFYYQPVNILIEFYYSDNVIVTKTFDARISDEYALDKKIAILELLIVLLSVFFYLKTFDNKLKSKSFWGMVFLLTVFFPICFSFIEIDTSVAGSFGGLFFLLVFILIVAKELRTMLTMITILALGFYGFGKSSFDTSFLETTFFVQHISLQLTALFFTIKYARRKFIKNDTSLV